MNKKKGLICIIALSLMTLLPFVVSAQTTITTSVVLNQTVLDGYTWPITIQGGTIDNPVVVKFTENITLTTVTKFFIIGSEYVTFDGDNNSITIIDVISYPGLIQNGSFIGPIGYNNITIKNIAVLSSNTKLSASAGWIGQDGFGYNATNVIIDNCHSNGLQANNAGGGIVGRYSPATVTNCSSTGAISNNGGGICGKFFSGKVINCHSTGQISGSYAGGITGSFCTGSAINCYSWGNLIGVGSGGIMGSDAGDTASVTNCYSTGTITGIDAGGIVGNRSKGTITNCYTLASTIRGSSSTSFINNCYASGGPWSDINASSVLTGTDGTVWKGYGLGEPYTLTPTLSNPIITGPNSETSLNSIISINENINAVYTFTADETVTWSLGNTNDEALFSIDSSGNLVFTNAPDYETPSSTLNSNTYIVDVNVTDTANNSTTQTLNITILDIANSTFGSFAAITKQYFTGTHTIAPPTTNNTNPIVYSSDNAAIATVSGSVITFTGVGTANITATQAADANYEGNAVSTLLTVLGKDLVSKYGGISNTDTNYVDANGNIGGAFGLDKYGRKVEVSGGIITSGLVMHLDAGNTASYPGTGTAWKDLSGNGNHGILKNGVTFNSANYGSLVFDGINDYFVTDNNLSMSDTDKLTIQVILKTASTKQEMIIEHSVNFNVNNSVGMVAIGNKMEFTDHNQYYNIYGSVSTINNNNWHLLSATTDRSLGATDQTAIYIDGNAPNKVNVSGYNSDNNGNFTSHKLFISSRAGINYFFNGNIAQVLVYNRALTAAEIQQNYNATKSRYGQ